MNYDTPPLGDKQFNKMFDDLRNHNLCYKSTHLGQVTAEFRDAEEHARQDAIYHFAQIWSLEAIETQLEALSASKILEKDLMATEWCEMGRQARDAGQYEQFEKWNNWRRDMRSLHRALSKIYRERLDEKAAKLAPKEPKKYKRFLGIFGL